MFNNIRKFVESKIGRKLKNCECIVISYKHEVIHVIEWYSSLNFTGEEYENSYYDVEGLDDSWDFTEYEDWLKEQGKEIF